MIGTATWAVQKKIYQRGHNFYSEFKKKNENGSKTYVTSTGLPTKDETVKTTWNSVNMTFPTLNDVSCHEYL